MSRVNSLPEGVPDSKRISTRTTDKNPSIENDRKGEHKGNLLKLSNASRTLGHVSLRSKVKDKTTHETQIPTVTTSGPKILTRSTSSLSGFSPSSAQQSSCITSKKIFGLPTESKLVVVGVPSVGKSAIVVRLLTGRFIWEYDPTLEAVYRYRTIVDDEPAVIEVLDTAGIADSETTIKESQAKWGDGFLIVYSLIDKNSFKAVPQIHASIAGYKQTPNFPCVLLGNKSDLVHSTAVSEEEANNQASELGVSFYSISACQGSPALSEAFIELHREVIRKNCLRRKRSSAKGVIEGFYKIFSMQMK